MTHTESSIKFNAEMILAIQEGRKTQTRRMVIPLASPINECEYADTFSADQYNQEIGCECVPPIVAKTAMVTIGTNLIQQFYTVACPYGDTGSKLWVRENSSASMPHKTSRTLLEITGIRVERLQDISEEDAMAEGVLFNGDYDLWWDYQCQDWGCISAIDSFWSLFCKIYDQKTWNENPWVWVITFKTLTTTKGRVDE